MSSTTSSENTPRSSSPVLATAVGGNSSKLCDEVPAVTPGPSQSSQSVEAGIDNLLTRHRNELMYELRRLQHGDRPVTGQDNRRNVEQFFNRVFQDSTESSQTPPEQNRPESVIVEVNALVERRPVSGALQSSRFRRSLENALRGAVSRFSISSPARRSPPVPAPRRSQLAREASASRDSIRSGSPAPSNHVQQAPATSRVPVPPPPPPLITAEENVAPPVRAAEWVNQQPLDDTVPTLEDAQREEFIMEISELVHRQLVTSTLSGDGLRNRLESMLEDRLSASGANGLRVQEFIQSIPQQRPHRRNDFSDLGIFPAQVAPSVSDDVSVISAAAAVTVPYQQSNAALGREVQSLKTQIQELKNMMRMSFDLQLDIQRSIRQEVSAAMAAHNVSASVPPPSRPASEGNCLICLDRTVDSVLYQCGHMCVCNGCGQQLQARGAHCPVCRAPIRDIIRTYRTN